jgi:hypothetical protein
MMANQRIVFLFALITFLLSTNVAYANGIPAIFFMSAVHVLIVNSFVIGIETFILRRLSDDKIVVGFMILANLASLFLAYFLTSTTFSSYLHNPWFGLEGKGKIERTVFLSGVALFIILTILIEWPFFHLAQKNNRSWIKTLKYSVIINLITNVPLALFYLVTESYYDEGE